VRERLVAGDSDKEVVQYVVARYGDFVLLKPPVQSNTMVLWLTPALFMVIGAFGLFMFMRLSVTNTRVTAAESGLSDLEQRQLADLLNALPKDPQDSDPEAGN
jgi:cytochrome c-type biogenesis protein CcmH